MHAYDWAALGYAIVGNGAFFLLIKNRPRTVEVFSRSLSPPPIRLA